MPVVCSECQFANADGAERCKRCKFPFDGEWPSLVSRTINNYELVRRVGGGGFGAVYEARHISLGNSFAVKILHPKLAQDSNFTDRFQAEARMLAELQHENVLQVIDFGFVENLGFYLITEWLEGNSLFRVLRMHSKPKRGWVWELFSQLLDALSYAHERGIIHRDLKPENLVLITGSRGRMVLKIVDFGIAQLIGGTENETQERSKFAVGTPFYMAPEQVRGDIAQMGPHTDLYACGVILAEMLTGQRPFDGGGQRETMRLQLEAFPPKLAELDPSGDYAEILEQFIQKALHKEVEHRFPNAQVFGQTLDAAMRSCNITPIAEDIYQDLKPAAGQKPGRKKRPPITYRKKEAPRVSRLVWVFAGLAALSVGLVVWMWMSLAKQRKAVAQKRPNKPRKVKLLKGNWGDTKKPDAGIETVVIDSKSEDGDTKDSSGGSKSKVEKRDSGDPPKIRKRPRRRPSKRRKVRRKRRLVPPRRVKKTRPPAARSLIMLRLLSKPSGAEIWINGTKRGTTPKMLPVKPGRSIQVVFKKKGYVSKEISVTPRKATVRKVTLIEDLF